MNAVNPLCSRIGGPTLPCDEPSPCAVLDRGPAAVAPRLAAALVHNVNNGLTGVVGYLELARLALPDDGPARTAVDTALRCAFQLAERVRRAAAFVANPPAAGPRASMSLRRAADEAAARVAASRHGDRVRVDVVGHDCYVSVNHTVLGLVLEQIICNALEAMPNGGVLSLGVWDEGPRRCLAVADNGVGLTAEVRRRLFEAFFTTKPFGHLGLGLPLCRSLMEAQGGALHVLGSEGRGTVVTLSFPPPDPSLVPAPTAPLPPPHGEFDGWIL